MFKEIVLPVSFWVLVVLVIVAVLTGVEVWHFSSECAAKGGTYSNEGMTAWCRY